MAERIARIGVVVVYALPDRQERVALRLAVGASAGDAVAASGLAGKYGLAIAEMKLGLGGQSIPPARRLEDGDRVELLRPLAEDPKDARRRRAAAKRR